MTLSPILRIASLMTASFAALTATAADGFLCASGCVIRARHGTGDVVLLRGVNLGGWLLHEPWMSPMDASGLKDDGAARDVLTRRFGAAMRDELIASYQDTYMTERDLDLIAAQRFNVVRLPFWYLNLQEEDGTWRADAFRRIDWLVERAWKRGIYTILDLHGAPGGQSGNLSTGRQRAKDAQDFWKNEVNLRRTEDIWRHIAARYRGHPGIAAYDPINEPMGAPDRDTLWAVYDRLYRAIRAEDPDHIVSPEVCWSGKVGERHVGWTWEVLPPPAKQGWSNVVYQLHHYEWDWNNTDKQLRIVDRAVEAWRAHRDWSVPCLVGEFNCMAPEQAWRHAFEAFTDNGMSWVFWNYKATHGTGSDSWGLYNPRSPAPQKPDLQKDSAETIRAKWATWGTAESFEINPMLARVLAGSRRDRPAADMRQPLSAHPLR